MEWIRDGIAVTGLILLATGLWWREPSACLIVVGALLLCGIILPRLFIPRNKDDS